MQETSNLYKDLMEEYQFEKQNVKFQTVLAISNQNTSIVKPGATIKPGTKGLYDESFLISVGTSIQAFSGYSPSVGDCVSGQIDIEMIKPSAKIPRQARLIPYVRLTDGVRHSEWIQKGVFYIDTREESQNISGIETIIIHGYDDMLKAESEYPDSTLKWPAKDIDVVREIANYMGVSLDSRTTQIVTNSYEIPYTTEYSCREILGYIAAMYGGCFIMSDVGELRLVTLWELSPETRYLVTNNGFAITFGGDRIIV